MEIQYVREFVTLAKYENYLVAAEELYISQSSLSKHIMALEKEFGFPLFSRTTRKVQLTNYGRIFLPYAQRIIDADAEFRNEMAVMKNTIRDSIQFGVIPAFSSYKIGDAVMEFKQKFPHYPIILEEGANEALIRNLKDGSCNMILVRTYDEPLCPEITTIPLLRDKIALITTAEGIFDQNRTSVSWEELEQLELLTSTSSQQAKMLASISEQFNIKLHVVSRLSRTHSIIGMLHKGVGNAALLNKAVSATLMEELDFRILDIEPPVYNTVFLAYMKDRPVTSAMRNFIDIAVKHAAKGEFAHV